MRSIQNLSLIFRIWTSLTESLKTVLNLELTQRTIHGLPIVTMKIINSGLLLNNEEQKVA